MAFHTTNYDLYVILGDASLEPAWSSSQWGAIAPILAPFASSPRGRAAARCTEYDLSRPPEQRELRFGRIGWDQRPHDKWTLGPEYPARSTWLFRHFEAWAPSWTVCTREGLAPDFYFALQNEQSTDQIARFNPTIVTCLSLDLGPQSLTLFRDAVLRVGVALGSRLTAYRSRQWGVTEGTGFTESIQDMPFLGLFRANDPHASPPSLRALTGTWKQLQGTAA